MTSITVYGIPAPQQAPRDSQTGRLLPKHGDYGSPEYQAWIAMKKRCCSPRNASYPRYGGRGISVCDRWLESFPNFLADMGRRPGPGYSLGRIENDGNYEPSNCRWETAQQQQVNRRCNHSIEFDGKIQTLAEWSRDTGISRSTLLQRLNNGWTPEKALTTAPDKRKASK